MTTQNELIMLSKVLAIIEQMANARGYSANLQRRKNNALKMVRWIKLANGLPF